MSLHQGRVQLPCDACIGSLSVGSDHLAAHGVDHGLSTVTALCCLGSLHRSTDTRPINTIRSRMTPSEGGPPGIRLVSAHFHFTLRQHFAHTVSVIIETDTGGVQPMG